MCIRDSATSGAHPTFLGGHQHNDPVRRDQARLRGVVSRCRHDIDDVAGPDEVHQRGVRQGDGNDARIGACGRFREARSEKADVGEHFAAASGSCQSGADDGIDIPMCPVGHRGQRSRLHADVACGELNPRRQVANGHDDLGVIGVGIAAPCRGGGQYHQGGGERPSR